MALATLVNLNKLQLLGGHKWRTVACSLTNPWLSICRTYVDCSKKAVFVTGCDSGFGRDAALMLDDRGYRVFAGCFMPYGEGATRLKKTASDRLTIVDIDVTNDEKISSAFTKINKELVDGQKLWALVNNAGVCVLGQFEWHTHKQMEDTMNVNVVGSMKMTKAFLPLLRESKGRVIFVGSMATQMPNEGATVYTASKYALVGLAKTLRYEMRHFGVNVVLVEPAGHVQFTNILGNQQLYLEQQWSSMTDEAKKTYEQAFIIFKKALEFEKPLEPPFNSLRDVTDLIQDAVESSNPKHVYRNASLSLHLLLRFTRFCSEDTADAIMHKYIMSQWKLDN